MPEARKIGLAVLLLLLAAGSWWLVRVLTAPKGAFDGHLRHDPDYTIENLQATAMNESGRRKYTLTAKLLVHYGDDESSDLVRPYLIKYPLEGAPIHVRADKGWMPKNGDVIVMTGHVRSTRDRDPRSAGGVMTTERMKILLDK